MNNIPLLEARFYTSFTVQLIRWYYQLEIKNSLIIFFYSVNAFESIMYWLLKI